MSCSVNNRVAHPAHGLDSARSAASVQCITDPTSIAIDPVLLGRIIAHMRWCLPAEGVGLVATIPGKDGPIADAYYPGTNIRASATRFTMDPGEVRRAIEDMARHGTFLGAVVHSHPTSVARPSPIDLRETAVPDALSIIVGFEPHLSIRAWRLLFNPAGKAFDVVECPIVTTMSGAGSRADTETSRIGCKRDS